VPRDLALTGFDREDWMDFVGGRPVGHRTTRRRDWAHGHDHAARPARPSRQPARKVVLAGKLNVGGSSRPAPQGTVRMKPPIGRDTQLCMSLSARPGNAGSRLHNALYEEMGLDFVYKSFSTTDLPAAIGGVRALSIRGCAVSMPFKEAVIPLIDALEPSAAVIESVNTIVNDGGVLTGYNTDYVAVRDLLVRARSIRPRPSSCAAAAAWPRRWPPPA
jgi:hypothetical protein